MSAEPAEMWERHADNAAKLETRGDDYQWQAADEYGAAHKAGGSYRDIAARNGCGKSHVFRMVRMAAVPLKGRSGLRFNVAYQTADISEPPKEHEPGALPEGAFRTIVADPPWRYENQGTRGAPERKKKRHYSTMTVEDICALAPQVPAADDAHLYLWVTNGFLRSGFDVLEAWDFTYKTCLTWIKPQIGLGNYFRNSTEHVLFAVRGRLETQAKDVPTWFEAKRGQHSAKPESFLDLVERCSPGPYLEMFARRRRMGWQTWGNEA